MRAETAASLRIREQTGSFAAAVGELAPHEDAHHHFAFLAQALDFAHRLVV